jgi:hypothetical protein
MDKINISLKSVHSNFKEHVNKHRGEKLKKQPQETLNLIYNANIFTGVEASKIGYCLLINNIKN